MITRAIILAGGKGTRLKPYTINLPKPLVPIGDRPILEIIIRQLKNAGFNHLTIAVNHYAELIKTFFGDGSKWGMKIDYTLESKPLSTMGPLTLIDDLPENFLVMNGDVLSDINLPSFIEWHFKQKSMYTIAAHKRNEKIDYGVLHMNNSNQLIQFEEKPEYKFLVSMGVYLMNRKVVKNIPKNTFYGFDSLMNALIEKSEFPLIYEYNGLWLDIGRPEDYEKAISLSIIEETQQ